MNTNTFDSLVNLLKKRNYSTDEIMHRIQVTIGATGLISTSQLTKLMTFFSTDYDKLELAKMAYAYVVDRDSYDKIVNKTFSFNYPKDHLCQFINRQ